MMTRFSIITVSKDDLFGLMRTVTSISNQSFQNYSHIIIDGGSRDGTLSYLKGLNDSKIKYLSETDDGIFDAMNKGIKLIDSEYVLFINSGDELFETTTLQQLSLCVPSNSNVLYYGDLVCQNVGSEEQDRLLRSSRSKFFLNHLRPPGHPSMVFPKTFLQIMNYDCNYRISADHKLKLAAFKELEIKKIDVVVTRFYLGGISANGEISDIIRALRERILIETQHWGLSYLPVAIIKAFLLGGLRILKRRKLRGI